MIRSIIIFLLLCSSLNAQGVFFPIKKGNKKYETTHTYINVYCLPKALAVSIRFKKPQKHFLKKQNNKFKYEGKKPNFIAFSCGNIIASKEGKAKYVFDGQMSVSAQRIYLVLRKGMYEFRYNDKVMISFHYSSGKHGVEIPNRVMIDMAATFYKNQKEIPRTAVIPGACQ
ncbi:hypothetical protein [Candidatus Uabimicrobium amorphum]|uniref:Uncharacterized protein n=1 Tax=Uabimicrobium amorphum TaxID=2596890 RepID=A0A5S9IR17_UABAM|nr:hypothetical protein [Candidatus Uabimicrobium amorphum]BBM86056.1 hypothetical protein UABAM_04442 [Candidatus Uabimicrobium amorphum]